MSSPGILYEKFVTSLHCCKFAFQKYTKDLHEEDISTPYLACFYFWKAFSHAWIRNFFFCDGTAS